ncbi:hypothetical protein GF312_22140 [Candidatus Poribacteria bacterium]|nr:hypothetical protein [Candidatus Poribacteria bacterium]
MSKKVSHNVCLHMMSAGRRFRPPLIEKVIIEYHKSKVPHNRWESVCKYIKELQPEDYQRTMEKLIENSVIERRDNGL